MNISNDLNEENPLILIVDDDAPMRAILRRVLEQEGYQVTEAVNGVQGIEIFQAFHPQAVLLDARMPDVDGFVCCSQIRSLPDGNHTPILMITSLDDRTSIDRAFSAGANDFITKPIHPSVLCHRVRQLLWTQHVLEELRQQTERERLLRKMLTQQVHQSLRLEDVLKTTVVEVREFLKADRAIFYCFGQFGEAIAVAESLKEGVPSLMNLPVLPRDIQEFSQDDAQRTLSAIADREENQLLPNPFLQQHQVRAYLEVPILQSDKLWGLLTVHHCTHPHTWKPFEMEAMNQLAVQVALAIRQAQVYQELERMNQELTRLATLDGLTQVANRRYFDDYLQREWGRAAREQTPLSLILCDIDSFKAYNDTYGHQAGDRCLQRVARVIHQAARRPSDLASRYGGEEFAVILPNTNAQGALQIAHRIRKHVKALKIQHPHSQPLPQITLSLGIACVVPHPELSPDMLVMAADRALYQAKTQGRDCIVTTEHCEPEQLSTDFSHTN
ncbi:MAG: diguanylate cyclase [Leptolyngbyaceae cyanobacterium bins.59]|nr:diguanylate cyclase [Leptolyngbyaceae cyanobacterium bins.59]